jgi:hypothetical protein
MKKIILLCSLLYGVATFAQSIASKDLVGTWKVSVITTPELSVDMQSMEVTLAPETLEWAKKKNKSTDALKKDALKNAQAYVGVTYYFSVKGIYKALKPDEDAIEGEYELTSLGGQNVVYIYYPEEDYEDLFYVSYKNSQLYLEYDEADVTLVCSRIK